VARTRLERIKKDWELAKRAEVCTTFDDAFQQGLAAKDRELVERRLLISGGR
jgi:hypothetical protein